MFFHAFFDEDLFLGFSKIGIKVEHERVFVARYLFNHAVENQPHELLSYVLLVRDLLIPLLSLLLSLHFVQLDENYLDEQIDLAAKPQRRHLEAILFSHLVPILLELKVGIRLGQDLVAQDVGDEFVEELSIHLDGAMRVLVPSSITLLLLGSFGSRWRFGLARCIELCALLQLGNELVHQVGQDRADRVHVLLLRLEDAIEEAADH